MKQRRRALPPGWYPTEAEDILSLIAAWEDEPSPVTSASAALAPHAGWAFSGPVALRSWASLAESETVAIIGGHLPREYPVLIAEEDFFSTPLGAIDADKELRETFRNELSKREIRFGRDEQVDNTVEIHLPFLKHRFPSARLLWIRAPAGPSALLLGGALAKAAEKTGRRLAVLGSSDLSHYGPDYDFQPAGRGEEALRWVKEVNDKDFIDALLALDGERALRLANETGAACSGGAAVAALSFGLASGATKAQLLAYTTSYDTRPAASFVGYGSVAFYR